MRVVWDPAKARENLRKHGVDFADAAVALEDENALTVEDRDHGEQRFKTLCMDPNLRILLVVYAAINDSSIRVISARKASRPQQRQYSAGIDYE